MWVNPSRSLIPSPQNPTDSATGYPRSPNGERGAHRTSRAMRKVPEITVYFWIVKLLTTAMGEATSDYLVQPIRSGHCSRIRRHCSGGRTRAAVPGSPICAMDLLVGRCHGRRVRNDGRRRVAHKVRRPLRSVNCALCRRAYGPSSWRGTQVRRLSRSTASTLLAVRRSIGPQLWQRSRSARPLVT